MLERLEGLSTKMMEFSSFLDSTENSMMSYIDKVISKINELQESLIKCQNSARITLTEVKGSGIQCGEQEGNISILFTEDKSKVQSFLNDSPVTYVIPVTSDDLLLLCHFWSSIMTSMTFTVYSVLDCRRIYDPGGVHFSLEIYCHTIMLNSTITLIR
jgi:hypothetical protein